MKRALVLIAALGLLVSALGIAMAEGDGGKAAQPKPALKAGTLLATGAGLAEMQLLNGSVTITVAANSEAELTVPSSVAVTVDKGTREEKKSGENGKRVSVTYKGFTNASFSAENTGIRLKGTGLTIAATGVGRITLVGDGAYTVAMTETPNTKAEGKWFVKPAKTEQQGEGEKAEGGKVARPEPVTFGEYPARKKEG